jgi:hypothetical protein
VIHGPLTPAESLRDSVATLIRDLSPFALCPPCIASKLTIEEREVRREMQYLVSTTSEFAVATRVCYGCRTTTRLLALRGGFASPGPTWARAIQ